MSLSKKPVKNYTRKTATGKSVAVTSYQREEETTPNQEAGQPDPLHNQVLSSMRGKGTQGQPIEYDGNKLKSVSPAAHNRAAKILTEVQQSVGALIKEHQRDIHSTVKKALKQPI